MLFILAKKRKEEERSKIDKLKNSRTYIKNESHHKKEKSSVRGKWDPGAQSYYG